MQRRKNNGTVKKTAKKPDKLEKQLNGWVEARKTKKGGRKKGREERRRTREHDNNQLSDKE